jgi:hypothetical protein
VSTLLTHEYTATLQRSRTATRQRTPATCLRKENRSRFERESVARLRRPRSSSLMTDYGRLLMLMRCKLDRRCEAECDTGCSDFDRSGTPLGLKCCACHAGGREFESRRPATISSGCQMSRGDPRSTRQLRSGRQFRNRATPSPIDGERDILAALGRSAEPPLRLFRIEDG